MKRIYLSGPMSGLPEHNFPAFHHYAAQLRAAGHFVVNPAEIDNKGKTWEDCLRTDLRELCTCNAIALIPRWEGSKGANLELHVAHRLGLEVIHLPVESGPKRLTFDEFREANVKRNLKWHHEGVDGWSASDWITAIVGELGELAGLIKMRNRERDGLPGNKFSPTDEMIAKEAADVYTYLDLFCAKHGIDLGRAAALKFNEVSERVGFPDRIELA